MQITHYSVVSYLNLVNISLQNTTEETFISRISRKRGIKFQGILKKCSLIIAIIRSRTIDSKDVITCFRLKVKKVQIYTIVNSSQNFFYVHTVNILIFKEYIKICLLKPLFNIQLMVHTQVLCSEKFLKSVVIGYVV